MKKVTVGADPFPPYQYYDDKGIIRGSDYDVVKSVLDRMDYQADYIIDDWSKIESAFSNKEIDIVFQVQKTPEREKKYYFSSKLRDATTSIITSTDRTDQKSIDELFEKGARLGVIGGYMYGDIIDSVRPDCKVSFNSLEELLQSVNSGDTEFGVVDLGVFQYLNKNNVYQNVKLLKNLNFNRPLYVCFNDESLKDEFEYYFTGTKKF